MSTLISLERVHLAYGRHSLLEAESLAIDDSRERVAVLGRNGAGKSSLLNLLAGLVVPDDGRVIRRDGLRVALMNQALPEGGSGTVRSRVTAAALIRGDGEQPPEVRSAALIDGLKLPADTAFETLSGGLKRRVLLAEALALEPELLLLDEPTNHLDVASIEWLEQWLQRYPGSVVYITHDRAFLRRLASRIVELDRGRLTSWPGDYDNYLRRRAEREHAQALADAHFDKFLAQEEAWIRQGIEARRTRSAGRVARLKRLRVERAQRREAQGLAQLQVRQAGRSGQIVIDVEHLSFAYGERVLVQDFSLRIQRGDRIGLVGPNGAGKSTLIGLLLGQLKPTSGSVVHGTGLEIAYFDQARAQLDEKLSAAENVAEGRTHIETGSGRQHIIGYLKQFLFTPEQANAPISRLSGGERNRLLLARLFSRPHNLLVLDEPTNDLDLETLELLEETIAEYAGTVLIVSHDRAFLDATVGSVLLLEGSGRIDEFVGSATDALAQRARLLPSTIAQAATPIAVETRAAARPAKLSYKDQRELEALPGRIEILEAELANASAALQDPQLYARGADAARAAQARISALETDLAAAYARWEGLESQRAGG